MNPRLLIIAHSARALAQSAKRGGYDPLVLDLYGDLDTRAVAREWEIPPHTGGRFEAESLIKAATGMITRHRPVGWLYGSGVDRLPVVIRALVTRCPLFGNQAEAVAKCIEPRCFFALLEELEISYPEIRWQLPDEDGWLAKTPAEGGRGVTPASQDPPESGYFQKRLPGPAFTLAFLCGGGRLQAFGFNRLYTNPYNEDHPFLFAGAINRVDLAPPVKSMVLAYASRLAQALDLRGWQGLDFMLGPEGNPRVLELNPRPGAAVPLWESSGWSAVRAQIEVCQGLDVPERPNTVVRAFRIVYASRSICIPEMWRWPQWCGDLSVSGTLIEQGEPVCSVHAEGVSEEEVEAGLAERTAWLVQQLKH